MASSGNFAILNRNIALGGGTPDFGTLKLGNTKVTLTDTAIGSVGVTSGKWYWEMKMISSSTSGSAIGWLNNRVNSQPELGYNSPASATGAQMVYMYLDASPMTIVSDGPKANTSGGSASANAISQNDIIGVAADFDNDKWYFSINGSFTNMRGSQNPATGAYPMCSASGGGGLVTITRTANYMWYPAIGSWAAPTRDYSVNFGQDSTFGGTGSAGGNADDNGFGNFKYSVPTGFLAMCSANLPTSSDIDPAQTSTDYPELQFAPILYTGNGTNNNAITGLGFRPDLLWLKQRDTVNDYSNALVDSSRGRAKVIYSQRNNAEPSDSGANDDVKSFDADGFTVGTGNNIGLNADTKTYVAWAWKGNGGTKASNSDGATASTVQANTKAGFSIMEFTGISGSSGTSTIGHGLTKAPEWIIIKSLDRAGSWWCQHVGLSLPKMTINLNSTAAEGDYSSYGTLSAPTSSVLSINGIDGNGGSGGDYICYAWHSVEGFSSFGSYVGNGNSDGTFIYTGFRPAMYFVKIRSAVNNWFTYDKLRDGYNGNNDTLSWNNNTVEDNTYQHDIYSNGFKIRDSNNATNQSGQIFIYGAWADVPAKYNNIRG